MFANVLSGGWLAMQAAKALAAEQRESKALAMKNAKTKKGKKRNSVFLAAGASFSFKSVRDSECSRALQTLSSMPLTSCKSLHLHGNTASDEGLTALAGALSAGALAACKVRSESRRTHTRRMSSERCALAMQFIDLYGNTASPEVRAELRSAAAKRGIQAVADDADVTGVLT